MSEKEWSRSWSRSDYNSEPARAGSENEVSELILSSDKDASSDGKPSDEAIRTSLALVREEIERAMRLPENAFTCALGALSALERRIVALEKESREVARPPQADHSVERQIAALRESLENESPQGDKSSSPKGEEHFLVAPIRGIDEDGRLILGDRRILSASALKI